MKLKTLLITLLFAVSMWAQTAATPAPADKPADTKATATCCKDGATCCKQGAASCKGKMADGSCCKQGAAGCKDGAACCGKGKTAKAECCKNGAGCCGKDKMAKGGGKDCCGGKMCNRHKA